MNCGHFLCFEGICVWLARVNTPQSSVIHVKKMSWKQSEIRDRDASNKLVLSGMQNLIAAMKEAFVAF